MVGDGPSQILEGLVYTSQKGYGIGSKDGEVTKGFKPQSDLIDDTYRNPQDHPSCSTEEDALKRGLWGEEAG